jgi:hypothetical protein
MIPRELIHCGGVAATIEIETVAAISRVADLNRTRLRSLKSKWKISCQFPAGEYCSKLLGKRYKILIFMASKDGLFGAPPHSSLTLGSGRCRISSDWTHPISSVGYHLIS